MQQNLRKNLRYQYTAVFLFVVYSLLNMFQCILIMYGIDLCCKDEGGEAKYRVQFKIYQWTYITYVIYEPCMQILWRHVFFKSTLGNERRSKLHEF